MFFDNENILVLDLTWTCSASVSIPRRMSVTPVATQTRAPLGTGIAAAPEPPRTRDCVAAATFRSTVTREPSTKVISIRPEADGSISVGAGSNFTGDALSVEETTTGTKPPNTRAHFQSRTLPAPRQKPQEAYL